MADRETILGRVRDALRTPRPQQGGHGTTSLPVLSAPGSPKPWLPAVGETVSSWLELFRQNSRELRTEVILVGSEAEARDALLELSKREGWTRVACHDSATVNAALAGVPVPLMRLAAGYDARELEACSAGVTACDALVAQTGSVLVTSHSAGGRALSVLPPHHVVVAAAGQLVPDLPAAFAMLESRYAGDWPSLISLITGPSRTGDIERVIVLGAHGPRQLTVVLIA